MNGNIAAKNSPPVDQIGIEERIARLTKRSIKNESKKEALLMAISMMDLTTLDAKDTPGKVKRKEGIRRVKSKSGFGGYSVS